VARTSARPSRHGDTSIPPRPPVEAATPPGPSLSSVAVTPSTLTGGSPDTTVYTQSRGFMFTLTNKGGGRYFDQRGWVIDPQFIIVRSNPGGSAIATLTS